MAQASAEKLEHIGPAKKERVASVPHREQFTKTPEPPLPKGKRNRAICPGHRIVMWERVKVSESHIVEREGNQIGSMGRKEWTPQQRMAGSMEKARASKEKLSRSRKKHEWVSGCKSSPGKS